MISDCDPSESSDESSTLGDQHEGDDSGVLLLRTFGLRSVLGLFVLVSVIVAVVQVMCYNNPSTKPRLRVIKKDHHNDVVSGNDGDSPTEGNSSNPEPVRKSGSSKSRGSGKNRVSGSSKSQNSVSGKKRAGQVSVLLGGAGMVAGGLGMAASKMLMHEEGGENLENIDILEIPPTEEELLMADLTEARKNVIVAEQEIAESAALQAEKEAVVFEAKQDLADAQAELEIQKKLVSIAESKEGVRNNDVAKAGDNLGTDNRTIGSQEADRAITGAGLVKTEDVADEDLHKVLANQGEASAEYQALKDEEDRWKAEVVNARNALDKAEGELKSEEEVHALAVLKAAQQEKRLAKAETNVYAAKRTAADQRTEEQLAAAATDYAETAKDSEGRVIEALDNDANFLGPDDSHDVEYTEESLTQNNVFNVCLVVFLLSFVLFLGGLLLFVLDHFGRTE